MRQASEAPGQAGALTIAAPELGVVIAGATGAGKTALAFHIARRLGGELVSADSRQVYRGLDAGTSKETTPDVPQHLLDVVEPDQPFDVGLFARQAQAAVAGIRARGKLPILVGGTGLYIKAFLEGLSDLPPRDEDVRSKWARRWEEDGEAAVRAKLAEVDPEAERTIPKGNRQRIIRALEVHELTGRPISDAWFRRRGAATGRWLCLRIEWPAEVLRRRLETRCAALWPKLLEEARALKRRYTGREPGFESLGYREALAVLEGRMVESEARALFVKATLAYAKRQRTWFRGQLEARPVTGGPLEQMAEQALAEIARARA